MREAERWISYHSLNSFVMHKYLLRIKSPCVQIVLPSCTDLTRNFGSCNPNKSAGYQLKGELHNLPHQPFLMIGEQNLFVEAECPVE